MLALMFAAALFAAQDDAQPSPEEPPETPTAARTSLEETRENPDRVVCRRETTTGTRFVKRTCRTVRDWEDITNKSQESFREVQTRPITPLCPPGGTC